LRELIAVFLLDAPGRLERIERQLDALDRARLPSERAAAIADAAYEAHSLSGASGTLRLEPLATQVERLELALRDSKVQTDDPSLAAHARELLGTIRGIVAELAFQSGITSEAQVTRPMRTTVLLVDGPSAERRRTNPGRL
jgi:HPt (histidine-containing phosphotransfer) domain-containing protein